MGKELREKVQLDESATSKKVRRVIENTKSRLSKSLDASRDETKDCRIGSCQERSRKT